jgi:hypothetical protein
MKARVCTTMASSCLADIVPGHSRNAELVPFGSSGTTRTRGSSNNGVTSSWSVGNGMPATTTSTRAFQQRGAWLVPVQVQRADVGAGVAVAQLAHGGTMKPLV